MNGVERIIMRQAKEDLDHVIKVYRSLSERGRYPQELVPFDLEGKTMETPHPLFLGIQGFINLVRTSEAIKELLNEEVQIQGSC